jgi:hypothetical protein
MMSYQVDLNPIIKLIYAQYPSNMRVDVVRALKSCKEGWWVSDNYFSYYHPLKHPESHWKERLSLKVDDGMIHIDVLANGMVEGIEFDIKKSEKPDQT